MSALLYHMNYPNNWRHRGALLCGCSTTCSSMFAGNWKGAGDRQLAWREHVGTLLINREIELYQVHLRLDNLLCCPPLSPQMVGILLVVPPTWKKSTLQTVSALGWDMENDIKSNLRFKVIYLLIQLLQYMPQIYLIWQMLLGCSARFLFSVTVRAHDSELKFVGDCQYVLLSTTWPLHLLKTSNTKNQLLKNVLFYLISRFTCATRKTRRTTGAGASSETGAHQGRRANAHETRVVRAAVVQFTGAAARTRRWQVEKPRQIVEKISYGARSVISGCHSIHIFAIYWCPMSTSWLNVPQCWS